MLATIQKLDDDYVVRLPENFVKRVKMKESDVVQVIGELGRIVIQKQEAGTIANDPARKIIDELFEDYDDNYEPIEIDWGKPVGNEIW